MAEGKFGGRSHRGIKLYFEGYEKQTVTDPDTGRQKTKYVYTGDYYCFQLEKGQFRRYKLESELLTLGGTAAFLTGGLLGSGGSTTVYSGVPAVVSVLPLLYLLMGLWGLVWDGSPKMTIREYVYGLGRMRNSLWAVLLLWAVTFLGHVVYIFLNWNFSALELGCAALELLAVVLLAAQQRVQAAILGACVHEAKSQYDIRPIQRKQKPGK